MSRDWTYLVLKDGTKVKVDKEDIETLNEYSWRVTKGTTGRPRVVTSVRKPEGVRSITLGHFLMDPPKGKQVYPRRFQEGLDYRKDNLIVCTLQERQQLLSKRRVGASSMFRGVSFSKKDAKWRAGIEVDGVAHNLGLFAREDEAALAYNRAAKKFFGDHAYQNQVRRTPKRGVDKK